NWSQYIRDHRDELVAIDLVMNPPRSMKPGQAYAELKTLANIIGRPNKAWTPQRLWLCHEHVGKATAHPRGDAGIPDLVVLIRYELGAADELKPYRVVVTEGFEGWLLRQRQAGVEYTPDQMWWLERICEVVASDVGIAPALMNEEPFR